jgi:hypothetical protein
VRVPDAREMIAAILSFGFVRLGQVAVIGFLWVREGLPGLLAGLILALFIGLGRYRPPD